MPVSMYKQHTNWYFSWGKFGDWLCLYLGNYFELAVFYHIKVYVYRKPLKIETSYQLPGIKKEMGCGQLGDPPFLAPDKTNEGIPRIHFHVMGNESVQNCRSKI